MADRTVPAAGDQGPVGRDLPGRDSRGGRALVSLVVGVATVAAMVTVVVAASADRSARAVTQSESHTGRATFYSLGESGLGNCSFPVVPADRLYAALGPEDYDHAGGCGGYIDVTGPKGTARVLAADKCPECEPGHLDLSPEAFAKIGDLGAGVIPITYRGVKNPAGVGPVGIRVKEGSSQWWIGFLATNHGNPLTSMEYRDSSGQWKRLNRAEYNYWLKEDGAGPGPFTLRLTDVYGQQAIVDGISLSPMVDQKTSVWMSGSATSATATATTSATAATHAQRPGRSGRSPKGRR